MRANKLFKRSKAKNGEGRQVKIKHILVPEEVADELELYKTAYACCLGVTRITYEQMFRRWLDRIGRIDPDVKEIADSIRAARKVNLEKMAEGLGLTGEELEANHKNFNPADPENEPWKMSYQFTRDGEEIEAFPGDLTPFYAKFNGRNVGIKAMLANDWMLQNEVGIKVDYDQAVEISRMIKEHAGR